MKDWSVKGWRSRNKNKQRLGCKEERYRRYASFMQPQDEFKGCLLIDYKVPREYLEHFVFQCDFALFILKSNCSPTTVN